MRFFHPILEVVPLLLAISQLTVARHHKNIESHYKARPFHITSDIYYQLELFSHYAAAAYCPGNLGLAAAQVCKPLLCEDNKAPCTLVSQSNVTQIYEFTMVGKYDIGGNIALDHDREITVLTIKGKISHMDELSGQANEIGFPIKAQVALVMADWAPCDGCKVSQIANDGWKLIEKLVTPVIRARMYEKLVVTSHGKGSSIATGAALWARNHNISTDLYTYGAPRVGNKAFAKYLTFSGHNFRVTHMNSDASRRPKMSQKFWHNGPEFYIRTIADSEYPQMNQIEELDGIENMNGNGGDTVIGSGSLNRWFFGQVDRCDPTAPQDRFGWISNRTVGPYGKEFPPGPEKDAV